METADTMQNLHVKLHSGLGYCLFDSDRIRQKYLSEESAQLIMFARTALPWYINRCMELEADLATANQALEVQRGRIRELEAQAAMPCRCCEAMDSTDAGCME